MTPSEQARIVEKALGGEVQCFYCEQWFRREQMDAMRFHFTQGKFCCAPDRWVDSESCIGDRWIEVLRLKTGYLAQ